jgi:L-cysteate sulfo-lyase
MNHFFNLGFFPTPIEELKNLSQLFPDYQIFTKRDDQTGLATGGNKTRKLEYLLQDAIDQSADTIITAGAQQSNHCRQTAAAAAKAGMKCHLVLGGHKPEEFTGNLLLSQLLGAELHFMGENRKGEDIERIAEEIKKSGDRPYIIPYGGSNSIGALGYVRAIQELQDQLTELKLNIDYIYFASSSGGTHAGMLMGKELFKLDSEIIGIEIDKDEINGLSLDENILRIINESQKNLGFSKNFKLKEIQLLDDYEKAGYGVLTDLEAEAIRLMAKTEGILLDPVYTGRAFYGMIDQLKNHKIRKGAKVLFWHTGGFPATFNYSNQLTK